MSRKRPSAMTRISDLIDAVMDGYVSWREESAAVETAYRNWRQAAPDEEAIAFDDYIDGARPRGTRRLRIPTPGRTGGGGIVLARDR